MTNTKDFGLPVEPYPRASGPLRSGVWVAPETRFAELLRESGLINLTAVAPVRSFEKGDFVYRQGDPTDGFHVVLSGSVKIVAPGADRVLAVCGPEDVFGAEACASVRQHRSEALTLAEGTRVMSVSDAHFREASQRDPGVAYVFATVLAQRVQVLEEEAEHARLPAQARLARTLLSLAKRFGTELAPGILELELDVRHDEIASLANTTRVSATRALAAWRELGLVRGTRGSYRIDVRGLAGLIELLEEEHVG